jgi:hypothetical protein
MFILALSDRSMTTNRSLELNDDIYHKKRRSKKHNWSKRLNDDAHHRQLEMVKEYAHSSILRDDMVVASVCFSRIPVKYMRDPLDSRICRILEQSD